MEEQQGPRALTKGVAPHQPSVIQVLIAKELFKFGNFHIGKLLEVFLVKHGHHVILVGRGIHLSPTLSDPPRLARRN